MNDENILEESQEPAPTPDYNQQVFFDNEWIKFCNKLSTNKSTKDIADYINAVKWTDNQKIKIMYYSKIVLGDGLLTSFITEGNSDWFRLMDDKALIDCNITLGMTVFDITPDFIILMRMIDMHFKLMARSSRGGFLIKRMNTHSQEIFNMENKKEPHTIKNYIGGNK